ncbi:MAG: class I SAM-dependent methyltransferase [Proteobacteria bacterium]|nr:class I SAM-dependent methyltransferase [Pseudomonadota bacterium]
MTGPPADCEFYHSQWDLRPRTREYLGSVDFANRSVLEIGPASGYLSFYMEAAGARVTCVEPSLERLWDTVPLAGFDIAGWRRDFARRIAGVRKAFWYLHRLHGSTVRVVEAEPYDLPHDLGQFDIGLLTSVLLHCRCPFSLLETVARHVTDTIVVADAYNAALGDDAVCRFLPHAGLRQVHTWWEFTPRYFLSALGVLGFPRATVGYHSQWSETNRAEMPMFTVVARR